MSRPGGTHIDRTACRITTLDTIAQYTMLNTTTNQPDRKKFCFQCGSNVETIGFRLYLCRNCGPTSTREAIDLQWRVLSMRRTFRTQVIDPAENWRPEYPTIRDVRMGFELQLLSSGSPYGRLFLGSNIPECWQFYAAFVESANSQRLPHLSDFVSAPRSRRLPIANSNRIWTAEISPLVVWVSTFDGMLGSVTLKILRTTKRER